jgi:putative transposase
LSELFLNKYRSQSIRKSGHDYTSPGAYFITINTDARIKWFGYIKNKIMKLSPIGEIVREEWLKSEIVRENIHLDEWIIMPNHIHGIIIINRNTVKTGSVKIFV